jgi:hypothetical protein
VGCPMGLTCGGGGVEGICGATDCPGALSCNDPSGNQQYCGRIGNGCGGVLDCPPTCANGMTCGMLAPNTCPGVNPPGPPSPVSPPPPPPPPSPPPPPQVR